MRRWFLSYHSLDQTLAQRLKEAIERQDAGSRVFFAPTSLQAGGYWSSALSKAIDEADVFVLLVGKHGIDRWQTLEFYEAHDRSLKRPAYRLLLVLLEGESAPSLPFLRKLQWIASTDPASEENVSRLINAAPDVAAKPGDLWRHSSPYRGLRPMDEEDADYFFGRERETVEAIEVLAGAPDKLPVLLGNSGVGKSSLARAGVLATLARQSWPETVGEASPWPEEFRNSRQWSFLTMRPGIEPVTALVETFVEKGQFAGDHQVRTRQWVELLLQGVTNLSNLLDAIQHRQMELTQDKAPTFLMYVDQGEELYDRAEPGQRQRFSNLIADGLSDPRLRVFMSLRSDFLGALQSDQPLFEARRQIDVSPLREAQLHEVVSRPAAILSVRLETETLAAEVARHAAEQSDRHGDTLPLLSYLLDDMWSAMIERGDAVLRFPAMALQLDALLSERANGFLAHHSESEDRLRRILTFKLATIREDRDPTQRRAARSEFTDEEWRLVLEMAERPYRFLVTAAAEDGETYAEVAHEAVFQHWPKLREWIAAEREFLAWRSSLEATAHEASYGSNNGALLIGSALAQAQSWLESRSEDLSRLDREFITRSIEHERRSRERLRRAAALAFVLLIGVMASLIGWINRDYVRAEANWLFTMRPYSHANVRPYVLMPEVERALKPFSVFRECARDCPEMVVVPAGHFEMGSPPTEPGRYNNEGPQHLVTIGGPFAISKFEVTFADWDACAAVGGCPQISDDGFGRGTRPVINVTWNDAQQYVAWLSLVTGRLYRLLSEAEWEYAVRAGTSTPHFFGISDATLGEYAWYESNSDNRTYPTGLKNPNGFGLYDVYGNVSEWTEDCYADNYDQASIDGSARTAGDCSRRVIRGGSFSSSSNGLRSASRDGVSSFIRFFNLGFRVGRSLAH